MTPSQLKRIRQDLKLSTPEAAKVADVSRQTLHAFEHGENVSGDTIQKLTHGYKQEAARLMAAASKVLAL